MSNTWVREFPCDDGAILAIRGPHMDEHGRIWASVDAVYQEKTIHTARINLLDQDKVYGFSVSAKKYKDIDWQAYLVDATVKIRDMLHGEGFGGFGGDVSGSQNFFGTPLPLPCGLPKVMSFDEKMLPVGLRGWVTDCAYRMQAPVDFVAVAAMVAISSVVGRQVGIRPKTKDSWLVIPNLWGAIVWTAKHKEISCPRGGTKAAPEP